MTREYTSIYGGHMEKFIALKAKLGFKFDTGRVILNQIDTYPRGAYMAGAQNLGKDTHLGNAKGDRQNVQ